MVFREYLLFFAFSLLLSQRTSLAQSTPEFSVFFNYTTSASIYPYGTAPSGFGRPYSFTVEGITGFSAMFSYPTGYFDLSLQLGTEYQQAKTAAEHTFMTNTGTHSFPVQEGYRFLPLELSLMYRLPFSTSRFEFSIGGGGGLYFGSYIREYRGTNLSTTSRDMQYGLHVQLSAAYRPLDRIGIVLGMKFRDPDLRFQNRYSSASLQDGASTIYLTPAEFTSRANIDGTVFFAGISYAFGIQTEEKR